MAARFYFTGIPCSSGHVSPRYESNGNCFACAKAQGAHWQAENKERVARRSRRWRAENPDASKAAVNKWHKVNREHAAELTKKWARNNPERMRVLKRIASGNRRAANIQRTPVWANLEAIRFFYECCPAGCHVDHIIPLQGKNVSGLHVETNLQWLPARLNISKGNRVVP